MSDNITLVVIKYNEWRWRKRKKEFSHCHEKIPYKSGITYVGACLILIIL